MKTLLCSLACVLGLIAPVAQATSISLAQATPISLAQATPISPAQAAPVSLAQTEQFALAGAGGEAYRILVALPEGRAPAPAAGYPVLYVLDAELLFGSVVETARLQARKADATGVAPAIVVGIAYPEGAPLTLRRATDYTPARVALPIPEMGAAMREAGGGADAFLDFIRHTVQPAIAARYPVNPQRQVLFGHSLGGLFVLHALFRQPQAFSHYIAASPSWWWNAPVMAQAEAALAKGPAAAYAGRALLLTVGEFEQQASRFSAHMPGGLAALQERAMVDNSRALAGRLAKLPGLSVEMLEIAGENHLSSLPQAINRGLRFALQP